MPIPLWVGFVPPEISFLKCRVFIFALVFFKEKQLKAVFSLATAGGAWPTINAHRYLRTHWFFLRALG